MATYVFRVELGQEGPPPDPPAPVSVNCEEHGRTTRAYVSGYDRARVHRSRLVRGDRRCLIADFNGAIPLSRRIVSATWRTNQAYASILSDARIVGREVAVDMTAGSGLARIKCVATLDNGEVYSQLFIVRVIGGPWLQGEASPSAGPNELAATAL